MLPHALDSPPSSIRVVLVLYWRAGDLLSHPLSPPTTLPVAAVKVRLWLEQARTQLLNSLRLGFVRGSALQGVGFVGVVDVNVYVCRGKGARL